MGTPEFAVPSLRALVTAGYNVVGVITATDKFGGRGKGKLIESPIKRYAVSQNIHVLQPANLKNTDFIEKLTSLKADLQVVVAFRMLPEVVWNMPEMGTLNLHGSLLPKYRGAAPINWAIINGDTETGVTTFLLKHEIDTGDILLQHKMPILHDDTAGDVHDRMMVLGAKTILDTVRGLENHTITSTAQDNALTSKAPKIFHETCAIDFNQPVEVVYNFVRGLSPYPAAWMQMDGKSHKVLTAKISSDNGRPGQILTDNKNTLTIACAQGALQITRLQQEGKRRMSVVDFLNGYHIVSKEVGS
ncbi:MAG: methionyl-tRNA formyltransferase [Bacteroidetes bacterium]|nr:MAG: methionyl-tRNA formyltransferase [Bacteroidota bacterium]